jgi:hypothetical protein
MLAFAKVAGKTPKPAPDPLARSMKTLPRAGNPYPKLSGFVNKFAMGFKTIGNARWSFSLLVIAAMSLQLSLVDAASHSVAYF